MGDTYTVALAFEVTTTDTDPNRFARMASHFGQSLPEGALIMEIGAPVGGVATVTACVPSDSGPVRALYAVATALEAAAAQEPTGLGSLGSVRQVAIELQNSSGCGV